MQTSTNPNASGTQFRKDIDGIGSSLNTIKEEAVAAASGVGQAVRSGACAAKETVVEAIETAKDRGDAVAASVEDRIRRNPLAAVGIATGVGLGLGMLFSRRRD